MNITKSWVLGNAPKLESEYRAAYLRSDIDLFSFGVCSWVAVVLALTLTDLMLFPPQMVLTQMAPLRLLYVVVSVSMIMLLKRRVLQYQHFNWVMLFWSIFSVVVTSIFFMRFWRQVNQSWIIISLLVIISFYLFSPNPLRYRIIAPLMFSATLVLELFLLLDSSNMELDQVTLVALFVINFIGITFSERLYSARKREYLARREEAVIRSELELRAATDPLTGVWNRRRLLEIADDELYRFHRYGRVFSILFMDLDGFKNINDSLGHLIGDTVLVEFAANVQRLKRESDSLGRMGGDEFCLLLPETPAEAASTVAERIISTCASASGLHPVPGEMLTVSIGITQSEPEDTALDHLYARADRALYEAKHNGRSQWAIH